MVAGTFVEGEAVLLVAGALAHQHALALPWLIACGCFGSAAWGQLWFQRLPWLVMRPWSAYVRQRFHRAGFDSDHYLFGIHDCGQLDLELLVRFIRQLPAGVSELHSHVSTRRRSEIDRTMPDYGNETELKALSSPQLMAAMAKRRVQLLAGFGSLRNG